MATLSGLLAIYSDSDLLPVISATGIEKDDDLAFLYASEEQAVAGALEIEGTLEGTAVRFGSLWRLTRQVAEDRMANGTATWRVCTKVTRLEILKRVPAWGPCPGVSGAVGMTPCRDGHPPPDWYVWVVWGWRPQGWSPLPNLIFGYGFKR